MKKPTGKSQSSAHKTPAPTEPTSSTCPIESSLTTSRLSELADQAMREIGFDPRRLPPKPSISVSKRPPVGHKVATGIAVPSERRSKLEEIKKRISQGYYESPEIRQKIVDRLADTFKNDKEDGD